MLRVETPLEKAWRYRGVLAVASVPVLLIVAVFMLVPRQSPLIHDKLHTINQLQQHQKADVKAAAGAKQQAAGSTAGSTKYAVVLDAGSTGSRIHVFKFGLEGGELKLISDTFEQLKPGLSSYEAEPQKAAESLLPLLATALKTVPKELQASTPISLKATAGLRLLSGDKAQKILDAVTSLLKKQPFRMAPDAVSIMGGQDEGGFGWLTLNYLLGKLGKGPENTVAAIDLGGGSVQEAFALPDTDAKAAPSGYIMKLKGGGKSYNVYVHSYLGFGLMAARAKLIDTSKGLEHPCFHKGHNGTYNYAGTNYVVKGPSKADGHFDSCANVGERSMEIGKNCSAPKEQCSFSGAWRGPKAATPNPRPYFISSYFWDRAIETGIISDPSATVWPTTPAEFSKKGASTCPLPDENEVAKTYKTVKADQADYLCLDLAFCHTLLTKGFGLAENEKITLVKQIKYNGQNIEAAWPLGAAINDLSD